MEKPKKHLWEINITFNSGKEITGYYYGNKSKQSEVAKEILNGDTATFKTIYLANGGWLHFKLDEIAAISITEAEARLLTSK